MSGHLLKGQCLFAPHWRRGWVSSWAPGMREETELRCFFKEICSQPGVRCQVKFNFLSSVNATTTLPALGQSAENNPARKKQKKREEKKEKSMCTTLRNFGSTFFCNSMFLWCCGMAYKLQTVSHNTEVTSTIPAACASVNSCVFSQPGFELNSVLLHTALTSHIYI